MSSERDASEIVVRNEVPVPGLKQGSSSSTPSGETKCAHASASHSKLAGTSSHTFGHDIPLES